VLAWKKEVISQYGTTEQQLKNAAKIKRRPADISNNQYNELLFTVYYFLLFSK